MPIKQDFRAYGESITQEINSMKDKIRNLIGDKHWQTDGEHKEEILRNVLRTHLPEIVKVGKGFVCFPPSINNFESRKSTSSHQIDILITSKDSPTLYKERDLVFVTADAVKAIIEVKTKLTSSGIKTVLTKLANDIQMVRQSISEDKKCFAGLFVYEEDAIDHSTILAKVQAVSKGNKERVINFISLGNNIFVRYWHHDDLEEKCCWRSYEINNLAPTYFTNNIVFELTPYNIPYNQGGALFPIKGTKEIYKHSEICLKNNHVISF